MIANYGEVWRMVAEHLTGLEVDEAEMAFSQCEALREPWI